MHTRLPRLSGHRLSMLCVAGTLLASLFLSGSLSAAKPFETSLSDTQLKAPATVAAEVDRLVSSELKKSNTPVSPITKDEDFLRRVTFDLAGTVPTPNEVTFFALNPDPQKRQKVIAKLLASDDYAVNWGRYWRDVVFTRATEQRSRLAIPGFAQWLTEQFSQNTSWDEITTAMLTASGDVRENPETGLLFAQGADASEIAAETSRIFLGIQIQCANCHDHPYDAWKREDFHELAAFFPRMRVQVIQNDSGQRRSFAIASVNAQRRGNNARTPERTFRFLDKNRDGQLTKDEVQDARRLANQWARLLRIGDTNKDNMISLEELKKLPQPNQQQRGSTEHYMPNLADPADRGTLMQPTFFVSKEEHNTGLSDINRREKLAKELTSPSNPWYARAYVNRIWGEMLGEAFYMPIDDIGPERDGRFPQVLDVLSAGFVANDYDVKWLFTTIASTDTYQRELRVKSTPDGQPFAAATPTRLRSDQLFNALTKVLGVDLDNSTPNRPRGNNTYGRNNGVRGQFNELFSFDPSTPQDEISGDVPQALFMMNSGFINQLARANANTRLGRLLQKYDDNDDAVNELYLLVLAREPSKKELEICQKYIAKVDSRSEAFEDLLWSLLNSSEFLSKR